jgi:branched-chain amino acid aminotransferase
MSLPSVVIKNGSVIAASDAHISIFNKSLFFGFAVYESVKVVQGKVFEARYHADRLLNSAQIIGLEHPYTSEQISTWMQLLAEKASLTDALLRILLVGPSSPEETADLFLFPLGLTFHPNKLYRQGGKAITFVGERYLPQAKTNNLLLNYLGFREAQQKGALDALLVDREGTIREGTRSNFFVIKGNELITPPLDFVLDGVTRRLVIKAAKGLLHLVERPILKQELTEADACFITSTGMNIMPLAQIDDLLLKQPLPEKLHQLMQVFKTVS